MSPRRACRKDANHNQIADAFRAAGCFVLDTYQMAQYIAGYPDLDVRRGARSVLVEVKTTDGELSADEQWFASVCEGYGVPCVVVRTVEEALEIAKGLRAERGA